MEPLKGIAAVAVLLALASIAYLPFASGAVWRWNAPPGSLLTNQQSIARTLNPYSLRIDTWGGKWLIVRQDVGDEIIYPLLSSQEFVDAVNSPRPLVLYRSPEGVTLLFASRNYTQREMLTLITDPRVGSEFGATQPSGTFALDEGQIRGKGALLFLAENIPYIVGGLILLYGAYLLATTFWFRREEE